MTDFDIERLTKMEERGNNNAGRLDRLEKIADAIQEQNTRMAELIIELKHTNENIANHEVRLTEIEKRPEKRLNTLYKAIIGAIASGIIGAVIGALVSVLAR